MARGKAAAADTAFSFDNVQVQEVAELPKGTRDTAPNPLEGHVTAALDGAPKALPVPNGERAQEAARLIRRAVSTNQYSLRLRYTDAEDKALTPEEAFASENEVWVYFKVMSEKKERAYTPRKYDNAQIREWANLAPGDKITKEIRAAFRTEHGFDTRQR